MKCCALFLGKITRSPLAKLTLNIVNKELIITLDKSEIQTYIFLFLHEHIILRVDRKTVASQMVVFPNI